jgi:flagellar biosynthesis/type III secretory pathway protein FliH
MSEHQQQRRQDLQRQADEALQQVVALGLRGGRVGGDSYFGDLYKKKRALGKKANTAILCGGG